LEFEQAQYLIVQIARQRNIVGFDLNEVSPSAKDEWDANVGARVLYQLCASLLK
jgi:agmatinase